MPHFNLANTDAIEIGDTVWVSFGTGTPRLLGVVEYIPMATGDCWRIRDSQNGDLNYVQQFERIILREKGDQNG